MKKAMGSLGKWLRKHLHHICTFIVVAELVVCTGLYLHLTENFLDPVTTAGMNVVPTECSRAAAVSSDKADIASASATATPVNTSSPKTFGAAYDACEAKLPSDTLSGYLGCCVDTVADDDAKACVANQLAGARSDGAPGDAQVLEQYRTCAAMNAGNMRGCFKRIL